MFKTTATAKTGAAKTAIALVAAATLLAACNTSGVGPRQGVGTVGGAVAGGVVGSQIGSGTGQLIATGAGAVLGALVGGEIGRQLDRVDRQYHQQTAYSAFETVPTGQTSTWNNPDSGNYGQVTPVRTYQSSGRDCRDFRQTVYVGGQPQTSFGTACRQPDGTWRIIN
jgi:surface antigen